MATDHESRLKEAFVLDSDDQDQIEPLGGLTVLSTGADPTASLLSSLLCLFVRAIAFSIIVTPLLVYGMMCYVIMSVCLCVDTLFSQKH